MEKNIFKFEKTGEGKYAGTCGHARIDVERSARSWRWKLNAAAHDGYPAVSRSGHVKADSPQAAQRAALEDAFFQLDDVIETGIDDGYALDPSEGGACQDVWEMLDGCGCECAA